MVFYLFWFQSLVLPSSLPFRMGSALLSRFDLVFILLDTPNEDHDHLLSEHVIAIRAGKQRTVSGATVTRMNSQDSNTSVLEAVSDKPLSERLKVWMFLLLSHSFRFCLDVRVQYVAYCRVVVYKLSCQNLLCYSSRVYINCIRNNLLPRLRAGTTVFGFFGKSFRTLYVSKQVILTERFYLLSL